MAENMRPHAHEIYRRYLDAVAAYVQSAAEAAGLHTTDWYTLSVLELAGPLSPGELAHRTGLTTGATTRLIDRLESAGHVRRIRAHADRRRVTVELMPELNLDIDTIVEPARRLLGEVLASYSPEEVAILFDYFARAAPAFLAATHEVRGQATARRRRTTPQGSQSRIGNR